VSQAGDHEGGTQMLILLPLRHELINFVSSAAAVSTGQLILARFLPDLAVKLRVKFRDINILLCVVQLHLRLFLQGRDSLKLRGKQGLAAKIYSYRADKGACAFAGSQLGCQNCTETS
jgi:hypothetical protein